MKRPAIPILPHARVLKDRYPVWLCDVWGVIHNGVAAFPAALDALVRFRASNGTVLLLTNAPRPAAPILTQLARLGVTPEAFDALVTSGDATRFWLAGIGERPAYHIGPERDRPLFADLGLVMAGPGEADVVICTGLVDDTCETVDDYEALLSGLAARGAQMMCANPDLVVDRGGTLVPCAGALAQRYEEMGGPTLYAGKPHRAIYDLAFAQLAQISGAPAQPARILAIGDGIKTDLAGAAAAGLDALFILGGIHGADALDAAGSASQDLLANLLAGEARAPVAAQRELVW